MSQPNTHAAPEMREAELKGDDASKEVTPGELPASERQQFDPGPPPDGGLMAWTQALMGHIAGLNTFGFVVSFGIFQEYYATTLQHPLSDISWIGSLQIFFLYFVRALAGRALDAGYYRALLTVGSIMQVVGVFMVSLASKYWQVLLAQGVCYGIGAGLVFCPMVGLVSTYFTKKRAFALGIVGAGGGSGGLVYPAIAKSLMDRVGFAWTVRVMGFVMLGSFAIMLLLTRDRLPPRRSGPWIDIQAFNDARYSLFSAGMFMAFWGQFIAYYYVGLFGRNIIGVSESTSYNLILVLNAFGFIGRMVPSFIADLPIGPLGVLTPTIFIAGVCLFGWAGVKSEGELYAFVIFYGYFSGGVQNLFPVTISRIMPDLSKIGTRQGMAFTIVSFSCLTGPPLAGALVNHDGGQYLDLQMFGGTSMVVGSLFLVACHVVWVGWTWPWNAQESPLH